MGFCLYLILASVNIVLAYEALGFEASILDKAKVR